MRIVYVLTSLGMGGAERQVVALAERMAKRGHAVSLMSLMPRKAEEWPTSLDTTYLDIWKTPRLVLSGFVRGRHYLEQCKPDVVHSHSYHANVFARLMKLATSGLVVISTVHNVFEGGRLRMQVYRLTDGLSRRTVAVSEAAAESCVRLGAVPAHKCCVVTNGIDVAEFSADDDRRARMRQQMGVSSGFAWLASGRIVPAKDYLNLLRALALLRPAHGPMQVWVAGDCPGDEMKRLRNTPEFRDVGDWVQWLGLRRDMSALLDAADGFVLSSAWEGLPLALGEAMAMGKPVVATDVGGVRELVGDCGYVVPAKDPVALAGAMREVMQTPAAENAALSRSTRQRVCQNFNIENKPAEWEGLYQAVLDGSR